MAMKPSQSYFLIDLIGGGVLIGMNCTFSLLKFPLALLVPAVIALREPPGDSKMNQGVEFANGQYYRLATAQMPLLILKTRLWAFLLLGGR